MYKTLKVNILLKLMALSETLVHSYYAYIVSKEKKTQFSKGSVGMGFLVIQMVLAYSNKSR